MTDYRMFITDAYTDKPYGGKSIGIVNADNDLTDKDMMAIAGELGQDETAFVWMEGRDSYKIRYFTPYKELEASGCGTIAVFWTLADQGFIRPLDEGTKSVYQESKAGNVEVSLAYEDGDIAEVRLVLPLVKEAKRLTLETDLLEALGLDIEDLAQDIPVLEGLGITGVNVPVRDKETVIGLDIKKDDLAAYLASRSWGSVRVYALGGENIIQKTLTLDKEVDEEKPIGLSSASLLKYLHDKGHIDQDPINIVESHKEGRQCSFKGQVLENKKDKKVYLAGTASISVEGVIKI